MANPFLFTEEVTSSATSFNPFLSGGEDDNKVFDNPFMSGGKDDYESTGVTNPFAFSEEPADIFSNQPEAVNYENIFAQASPGMDIFSNYAEDEVFNNEDVNDSLPKKPPPPRPGPPKETKDLILSVTGAMEATSSHLLDRLQATRTPSPTPMRDLHSPSPTQFGDLLEVDEPIGPAPDQVSQPQEINLLGDDFDCSAPIQEVTEKRVSVTESVFNVVPPIETMSQPTPISFPIQSTAPPAPTVVSAPPVLPPTPAVSAPPVLPPTPAVSAPPVLPPTPAVSAPPVLSPTPAVSAPPVLPPTPAVTAPPVLPPAPVASAPLVLSPAPVVSAPPVLPPAPVVSAPPVLSPVPVSVPPVIPTAPIHAPPGIPSRPAPPCLPERPKLPPQPARPPPPPIRAVTPERPQPPIPPQPSKIEPAFADVFSPVKVEEIQPEQVQPETDFGLNFTIAAPQIEPESYEAKNQAEAFDSYVPQEQTPYNAFDSFPTSAAPQDAFDAFSAKFDNAGFDTAPKSDPFDAFSSTFSSVPGETSAGFADDNFDSFLSLREPPPVPQGTPARVSRNESTESADDAEFNIFIKPKVGEGNFDNGPLPALAPPPVSNQINAFTDTSPRLNPFDNQDAPSTEMFTATFEDKPIPTRTDSQETPPTPLFDDDVSQPLEDFPRINYDGEGWEMQLRQPNKKKITGQRFWKKIFIKLVQQGENPVLQLSNSKDDKDPFQELPLQPCYSVSDIAAQQYDQYGKIFTVKLQFIFYKERPGVRPGQVTKAERITNKLSQFAAYAIQGDYQGVKEFGSDLKKLGLPVEHAPQISQLFKIGSQCYEDMKQFSMCVEESLFRLSAHRDRALTYKMEEVQITAVDELYVEQSASGAVEKQIARVRLFFLGFLSGMPDVELGVNDLVRQGKEVVGRHDIIPVVTEEWIRLEAVEFHTCIQQDEYERTRTIKFKPPDASYLELMRFRVRPPKNRELPIQLKTTICVTGNKVEIRGDILVPGFTSRKLGQIPCEDVMVRIPIPECWIYQFRVEKHFRYGSVKSAHRRTGKVKGIERFLGAIDPMEQSLMEVTSGQAKYEHQHRAIVWRMPRLPKEGQGIAQDFFSSKTSTTALRTKIVAGGSEFEFVTKNRNEGVHKGKTGAYTTHNLVVRLQLTSYDQIPDQLAKYCYLEFTMPATTVSHTTVRSVSIVDSDSDGPPEKYVRQLSRHEYRVEIEHTQGEGPGDYIAATVAKPTPPPPIQEEAPKPKPPPPESDSDSSDG